MRIFPHFNKSSKCIICGTNADGPACLIALDGTSDGHIEEGEQVHVECLSLRMVNNKKIIYQKLGDL